MTTTLRSNLFVPQILQDAIRTGFAGKKALYGTGAAILNGTLPETKRGGDTVTVPYFAAFGASQDTAEGTPIVPAALSMSSETASVIHSGNAVTLTKWAEMAAAFADPYAAASDMILETIVRRWDQALIDAAVAASGLPAAQKIDVWNATTPVTLNYSGFVDAKLSFGDEQNDICALVVHSKVLGDMYKLMDGYGRPLLIDSASQGGLPLFLGVPTIVSDRMTKDVTDPVHPKYTSLLIKKNALVSWYNGSPAVEVYKDVLLDSEIFAWHSYFAAYRYSVMPGFSKPGVVTIKHN
jgi:hypothetical protein